MPRPRRFLLLLAAALLISSSAHCLAALVGNTFTWDFTLQRRGNSNGGLDHFIIGLEGTNKIHPGEFLAITILAQGQSVPVYFRNWTGIEGGLNGLLVYRDDEWDDAFPIKQGTVILEMRQGSVDLKNLSIEINSSEGVWNASIYPRVTLVPEPSLAALSASSAALLLRRRRATVQRRACPTRDNQGAA